MDSPCTTIITVIQRSVVMSGQPVHNYHYVLERNFANVLSSGSKASSYDDMLGVQVLGRKVNIRSQVRTLSSSAHQFIMQARSQNLIRRSQ